MKVNILVAKFFLCCKISADFVKWRGVGFVMYLYWDFQASSISGIKVGVTGLVTGVRCYRLIHFLQGTSAFQVLWKVESCCQLGTLREKEKKKKRNPNPYQHPSKIHSERRGGGKRGKKTPTEQASSWKKKYFNGNGLHIFFKKSISILAFRYRDANFGEDNYRKLESLSSYMHSKSPLETM